MTFDTKLLLEIPNVGQLSSAKLQSNELRLIGTISILARLFSKLQSTLVYRLT